MNFEDPVEDFLVAQDARFKLYERVGVDHLLSRYLLNVHSLIGFDVLVLDRMHAVIGFTKLSGVRQSQSAILFENQPNISSDLADWFDQIVVRSAIPFDEWLSEHA